MSEMRRWMLHMGSQTSLFSLSVHIEQTDTTCSSGSFTGVGGCIFELWTEPEPESVSSVSVSACDSHLIITGIHRLLLQTVRHPHVSLKLHLLRAPSHG